MGNCLDTCLPRSQEQEEPRRKVVEEGVIGVSCEKLKASDEQGNCKELGETGKGQGGIVRVKIVLTKEELQWLMMQLNSNGEKRLENILEEIERGRKKVVSEGGNGNGWKPSLESIMEIPECLEIDPSIRLYCCWDCGEHMPCDVDSPDSS